MEPAPRQALPWGHPGTWLRLAGFVALYVGLAQLGLRFALSDSVASPLWAPAGLAVAAAALWGLRALPAVFVGTGLVELTAGVPPGWSLLMAAGNSLEAGLASVLLRRHGAAEAPRRLAGVGALAVGSLLGPLAAATFGAGSLVGSGMVAWPDAGRSWWTWYLGDMAGILVVAPPLLMLSAARDLRHHHVPARAVLEGTVTALLMAASAVGVFLYGNAEMAFLTLAPLTWIAVRFGPGAASGTILAVDVLAAYATATGRGFAAATANASFLMLQAFALTASLLGLCVAAIASHRRAFALGLERRVADRTTALELEVAQRRQAQKEAEEAQRVAQMGTWWWDITKPNAEWSPELYRIYGLDPATHVPTYDDYLTRVHPDDRERVRLATEAVFKDQRPYSHDERVRRPDGSWRHLHTWAHAVLGPDGKLMALAGACQDITERVAQEDKFRGLLESAPDAMVIVDAKGQVVLVNSQAEKMFGYRRDELLGRSIEVLVPDASRGVHAGHRGSYSGHPRARAMGAGLDLRARRKDGSEFPVEISLSPLETPEGLLVSSAIRDVTQRRRDAQMLNESLERFRALAESSPIGIVHTSPQGSVDYANQTWSRITGVKDFRDDEAVRKAIHPDDQPRSWTLWSEAFRTGAPFEDDMRWVHADGSIRHTHCRATPTRGPDGSITGFVSTVEDITERVASEAARRQRQEAELEMRRLREQADFKTNFLRTAAHELGTPLTPLKIQLRVLRDLVVKRADPDEARAVAILDRNVDRLQVLVRDLLESARLQSGRLRLNARSMDLAHVVHDVVETFQEPAIHGGIALDAQVPPHIAMVGDPDRITQVLYNLISNAMKFTGAGGRVHVVADEAGDVVRLEVQDSGAGFTPEQASHLFQPFSQVHDPMQLSKPGSGLGLYICKGIVEQHGGAILAHSDGPGKGARFTVTMPRVARAPAPEAKPAEAKVEPKRAA